MFFNNDLITLALKISDFVVTIISEFVLLQEHRVDMREEVPLVASNHFAVDYPIRLTIMSLCQER